MDEKDKDKKPNIPPIPPSGTPSQQPSQWDTAQRFPLPDTPSQQPSQWDTAQRFPLPPGLNLGPAKKPQPPVPPAGGMPKPVLPQIPGQGIPVKPQGQAFSGFQQTKDSAMEEVRRIKEEKEALEKKILEMEKALAQEKEKALLATLKSQQDEVLSSKVETSLREIQEKLRRDRHDQEIQEERLRMQAKIKELETKLVQERETWMQTLKTQMQQREAQDKDVETHFLYRLQEMERRWLDEKAQWQKILMSKEDEIRSLKATSESSINKFKEIEDEFRKTTLEKSMLEKEISRMKDEMARIDREKASIESYIKEIPEKEKDIANLKAEVSILKMREEKIVSDYKAREEKMLTEIDKLQKEIGSIADRKHQEKEEEIKKLQANYDSIIQEKERTIAEISGEKIRAISELVRMKGFIAKIQAINAALEKERAQMRSEKMQIAQNLASNLEETKKIKQELDFSKNLHQTEITRLKQSYQDEIERIKAGYRIECRGEYAQQIESLQKEKQEEIERLHEQRIKELSELQQQHQTEIIQLEKKHREEIAEMDKKYQEQITQVRLESRSEIDDKILQIRNHYETTFSEMKNILKNQIEQEYIKEMEQLKSRKEAVEQDREAITKENDRLKQENISLCEQVQRLSVESALRMKQIDEENKLIHSKIDALMLEKAEYEKYIKDLETERKRMIMEYENIEKALKNASSLNLEKDETINKLKEDLKLETENRSRFESELMFLKPKLQQREYQIDDLNDQLKTETENFSALETQFREESRKKDAIISELREKLDAYKDIEKTFTSRIKWAIKGQVISQKEKNENENV